MMTPNATSDDVVDLDLLMQLPAAALLPVLRHVPGWQQATEADTEITKLTGAMTNLVYRCRLHSPPTPPCPNARPNDPAFGSAGGAAPAVLARVQGRPGNGPALLDRAAELETFRAMAGARLGPQLLLLFANGRLEELLEGYETLTAAAMLLPAVSAAIAAALAAFHFRAGATAPLGLRTAGDDAPSGPNGSAHTSRTQGKQTSDGALSNGPLSIARRGEACAIALLAPESSPAADGCGDADVWQRLRRWHALARAAWSDDEAALQILDILVPVRDAWERHLRRRFSGVWTTLCHGDLQYGNIMTRGSAAAVVVAAAAANSGTGNGASSSNSADGQAAQAPAATAAAAAAGGPEIRLIDYEYACVAPVAFDIANHWCEWAADYATAMPHVLDYSRLPSEAQQLDFVRAYLKELMDECRAGVAAGGTCNDNGAAAWFAQYGAALPAVAFGGAKSGAQSAAGIADACCLEPAAAERMANDLREAALAFLPVSHLHWALWGYAQARVSHVDFDYVAYAEQRLSALRDCGLPP